MIAIQFIPKAQWKKLEYDISPWSKIQQFRIKIQDIFSMFFVSLLKLVSCAYMSAQVKLLTSRCPRPYKSKTPTSRGGCCRIFCECILVRTQCIDMIKRISTNIGIEWIYSCQINIFHYIGLQRCVHCDVLNQYPPSSSSIKAY